MRNISCIIQARINSSRLPAKIMLHANGKPLLENLHQRLSQSKKINQIIVATSNNKLDDLIYNFCKKKKYKCFRGSENDVLSRYYNCAKKFKSQIIVRITADCPLIDKNIIDDMISEFLKRDLDYLHAAKTMLNDSGIKTNKRS